MASELSKFIDDELQKVDSAEERERLISKLRVRTSAKETGTASRAGSSWQEQLLPRKRLLVIGLCAFFLIAIATVAFAKGGSSKDAGMTLDKSSGYALDQDESQRLIDNAYPEPGESSSQTITKEGEIPPPVRETGVESNSPESESPNINIRDDAGSSVTPENADDDALTNMPPIPPHHKHPASPAGPRKVGPPSTEEAAVAAAPGKSHTASPVVSEGSIPSADAQEALEEEMEAMKEESMEEEELGLEGRIPVPSEEAGFEAPSEDPRNMDLAPTPELEEQQRLDKETESYESAVEEMEEEKAAAQKAHDSPSKGHSQSKDPVFGGQPAEGSQVEMGGAFPDELRDAGDKSSPDAIEDTAATGSFSHTPTKKTEEAFDEAEAAEMEEIKEEIAEEQALDMEEEKAKAKSTSAEESAIDG